jgi:hypothetical protein
MRGADTAAEWDEQTFERVLEQLRTDGTIDATGVDISAERFSAHSRSGTGEPR